MAETVLEHRSMADRLISWTLWIGLGFGLSGVVVYGYNPSQRWTVSILETLALLFMGTYFVVRFESVRAFAGRRSTRMGANSVLMTVLFLAILGILNFLGARHNVRMDLSETGKFTLAPQTLKVLNGLGRDVKITAFSQSGTPTEQEITDLLNSYSHISPRITYHLIDPDKNPAVAKNYGITVYDTLVLESGKQETQIKDATEQELTNAIIRVSRDEKQKVLFVKEHGEHRLDDAEKNGYSYAKDALTKQGYDVGELSLLTEDNVPEDARVVILAGPKKPLFPQEKTELADYLDRGGKVIMLIDPQVDTNLSDFLLEWGIRLGPGLIVDTISRLFGGDFSIPIVNNYPPHEITQGFNIATFYPLVQSVTYDSADPNLLFKPLAETTPNSWTKSDISGPVKVDPKTDRQGPFTVAGIVTRTLHPPARQASGSEKPTPPEEAALVVFGDSDFANNSAFYFNGNGDLFLNTVNFLAKERDLIAITPKEHRFTPLFLSKMQGQILMYASLIVVPGVVFIAGFRVWRRRRRL